MSEVHEKNEKNKKVDGKLAGNYFNCVYLCIGDTKNNLKGVNKEQSSGQDCALLLLRNAFP